MYSVLDLLIEEKLDFYFCLDFYILKGSFQQKFFQFKKCVYFFIFCIQRIQLNAAYCSSRLYYSMLHKLREVFVQGRPEYAAVVSDVFFV